MLTSSVPAPTEAALESAPKPRPSLTRFPSSWIPLSSSHPLGSSTLSDHLEPNQRVFLDPQKNVKYLWKSRGHRKGCAVEIQSDDAHGKEEAAEPEKERAWKEDSVNDLRWWGWDYWDISWWVAGELYISLDFRYKWRWKADLTFVYSGNGRSNLCKSGSDLDMRIRTKKRLTQRLPPHQTLGSIWWCINALFFFCYFSRTTPSYTNTEAATAFLGGSTFLVGSYLGWIESLNPARDAEFGWEVDELRRTLREPAQNSHQSLGRKRHHFGRHLPHPRHHHHHHSVNSDQSAHLRHRLANPHSPSPPSRSPSRSSTLVPSPASSPASPDPPLPWRWYGTTPTLAYIANTVQLFGSVTFFISVLCGLPGILPVSGQTGGPEQSRTSEGLWIAIYWGMQIVGAPCFMFAGMVFALETQEKWWMPKIRDVGWQM
ncbi:hypothetical protein MVLG_06408 [Microbotryum lychnidis-dioicae p1A1 Lamole]|uniref:Integral membrane protein n=1 Tax=Microbotryum lychnidis-dioicae (strain p1A1 Lamole / MvSl-1064) TaxID=683840 RepID=U5HH68_USTV1|nr:hypothetical protein MVLG_06408 [Microbotryum lychnidis-dioicae p1A1 Lamole]|eukprot:KDE03085.1 hypothetical protein MVLG_06408 [Microbotryum lychnidis-dioicae p1A1 Lamole]